MIVGRMAKHSQALLALLIVLVISSLPLGMNVPPQSDIAPPAAPAVEADSSPSVTCTPFGLYGDITTPPVVDRLSDSSDKLTFVGTTNGLYVVAAGGKLQHFLYSPFGIKHMALIDDITGDGIREVVVALNDTQVPALRCYDGATWEKLWQFAPMTRIWDKVWVDRQLIIENLEVIGNRDSQSLLITSGRCVFSVSARDGTEQWRFIGSAVAWRTVTLADLNNDGADEAFVGSDDGNLFWLNGRTGKALWRTKLPEHEGVNYGDIEHQVSDIVVLDEEAGKVAVASADGWAQMYDLAKKKREWDTRVFKVDQEESSPLSESTNVYISPAADFTEDGLPEVLLTKTPFTNSYLPVLTSGEVALCDSAGSIVWHKGTPERGTSVRLGMAFETSVFEGKPVYLDMREGIAFVDLRDGESVLHTISLDALNGPGVIVMQPGGNGYLSFSSSSDLAAISAAGELLWYYPRITGVKAESGSFVGDGTEDVLLCAESGGQMYSATREAGVRLLRMMDGATGAMVWSYEFPYGKLKMGGGLKGVRLTADLLGSDNIQDIVGYCEDEVCIFSGKDGAISTIKTGQTVTSLDVIGNGASGIALAVGNTDGLMIFGSSGASLWTTATADWLGEGRGSFAALDDINADNVSDLAVASDTRIVVLTSNGSASDYTLHQTIQSEDGSSIKLPAMVADCDQDGIRELACFHEKQPQQSEHLSSSACHVLCIQSLDNSQCLFKANLQGAVFAHDLACGDFNGDGCPDSVLLVEWIESNRMGLEMRVVSGRDGTPLWTHSYEPGGYGYSGIGSNQLPAVSVGDMNGDGADELACNVGLDQNASWDSSPQQRLQIFDVANDTTLKDIAVAPRLHFSSFGDSYDTGSDEAMLLADLDNDGRPEVLMKVAEPSERSYDRNYSPYHSESSSPRYLAVVDMDTGRRLATFKGFETETISLFQSHQPGMIGVAACGGVCYLQIDSDLEVSSPEDGARTEPIVGLEWQGPTDGDFSQVFVDGVRNDITGGCGSELFLARGSHAIVVRSIDEYGRISYGPSDMGAPLAIKVTPSPWKPLLLMLSLFFLLTTILLLFYARLHRTWRARKRATK